MYEYKHIWSVCFPHLALFVCIRRLAQSSWSGMSRVTTVSSPVGWYVWLLPLAWVQVSSVLRFPCDRSSSELVPGRALQNRHGSALCASSTNSFRKLSLSHPYRMGLEQADVIRIMWQTA